MKLIFWLRSFLSTLLIICLTAIFSVLVLLTGGLLRQSKWADDLVRVWGQLGLFVFGIRLTLKGDENIPEGGCIFVFNHSSHFDIVALAAGNPRVAHFGAKIELFKIPVFGHALRALGSLPIMRGDRDKVLRLYDESIARVRSGECFYLAAEGTRHSEPGVGKKFKTGPFIFAINAQVPIVPIVIRGAAECLPKDGWLACTKSWRHYIHLRILPPYSTKGLTLDDRQRMTHEVRNLMTTTYNEI